jgi:hypothetical protein
MSEDEDDYLFDKKGEPDLGVRDLEKVLGAARYVAPRANRAERAAPARRARGRVLRFVAPLAIAAAILIAIGLRSRPRPGPAEPSGPSFAVTRVEGSPRVDARPLESGSRLAVGAWLETDPTSRAQIQLAQIGVVAVGPSSRIRVVAIAPNEQRLELERGAIEAHVNAVPRLFVVDTPSARATDLGCAYHLEVVPDRGTVLRVTSGAVELAGEGRQAHVPAGSVCETRPSRGPGCPYFDDASDAFKTALRSVNFDPEPNPEALDTLLATARARDTLTLWQLVWRVPPALQQRVMTRVAELVPPRPGTDLDSGSPAAFQKYQDDLVTHW